MFSVYSVLPPGGSTGVLKVAAELSRGPEGHKTSSLLAAKHFSQGLKIQSWSLFQSPEFPAGVFDCIFVFLHL